MRDNMLVSLAYFAFRRMQMTMLLMVFLLSGQAYAYNSEHLHLLEVDYLSMEYKDLRSFDRWKMRNTYLAPNDKEIEYGLALNFDWKIVRYDKHYVFWENEWAFYSEETHVRDVYWDFKLGLTIVPDVVRMYYRHKSEHILDLEREQRFPVLDEGVIEVIFIPRK
jgi:hypothetical protein